MENSAAHTTINQKFCGGGWKIRKLEIGVVAVLLVQIVPVILMVEKIGW